MEVEAVGSGADTRDKWIENSSNNLISKTQFKVQTRNIQHFYWTPDDMFAPLGTVEVNCVVIKKAV